MKLFAYALLGNNHYQRISIFQALYNKHHFPKEWEKMKYYLNNNPNNPIELIASGGSLKAPHFKSKFINDESIYLKNPNYKTLTHNLCQDVLSSLKNISIHTESNNILNFYNCTCETEKHILSENELYVADLYFTFEKSEPSYLAKLWDNHFIIEIYVTHEVPDSKALGLYMDKHAVFQVNASKKTRIYLDDHQITSENALNAQIRYLEAIFSNKVYAKLISNPAFHDLYKRKIKMLNNEIDALNKELNNLKCNSDNLVTKYNNLVAKYNNAIELNRIHTAEKSKLQQQIETFNKSFVGKFYKVFNK